MVKITVLSVVGLVVLVLAIAGAVSLFGGGEQKKDQATVVRVHRAALGDLTETVTAPGRVQPKTKVAISARVAARITELPFAEGDEVTKGDPKANPPVPASVLVRLDATELEAQLRAAQARRDAQAAQVLVQESQIANQLAQLQSNVASLAQADRDLKRQQQLWQTQDVSRSTLDDAQSKYDQLFAQHEAATRAVEVARKTLQVLQHNLEAANADIVRVEDNLSYTVIASPIDGVVTDVKTEVGELAVTGTMNNPGTVIIEVADLSKMLVVAQVDETDVPQVKVGQSAKVHVQGYPNRIFTGTVGSVALVSSSDRQNMSDQSKYFEVEVALETNGERIPSGLSADVEISTVAHSNVLAVPSQAVVPRPTDDLPADIRKDNPNLDPAKSIAAVIYRFRDGKAVATPVSIGPSDMTATIITGGLAAGDEVVVGPFKVLEAIKHDQAIKPEETATAPATAPTTAPAPDIAAGAAEAPATRPST